MEQPTRSHGAGRGRDCRRRWRDAVGIAKADRISFGSAVIEGRRAAGDGRRGLTADTAEGSGSLLRVLGVAFGLAVAVGNTIGAGILRTPGDIAGWLSNPLWFIGIWVVGAL